MHDSAEELLKLLGRNTLTLFEGDQYQMQGIFTPPDASNRGITWQSNNEGVAQVVVFRIGWANIARSR